MRRLEYINIAADVLLCGCCQVVLHSIINIVLTSYVQHFARRKQHDTVSELHTQPASKKTSCKHEKKSLSSVMDIPEKIAPDYSSLSGDIINKGGYDVPIAERLKLCTIPHTPSTSSNSNKRNDDLSNGENEFHIPIAKRLKRRRETRSDTSAEDETLANNIQKRKASVLGSDTMDVYKGEKVAKKSSPISTASKQNVHPGVNQVPSGKWVRMFYIIHIVLSFGRPFSFSHLRYQFFVSFKTKEG